MKKILIAVGALGVMSFTTNQVMYSVRLAEAITNVQDMKEWMIQDIEMGNIDENLGKHYMYWLEETENDLIEYVNQGRYPRQVKPETPKMVQNTK